MLHLRRTAPTTTWHGPPRNRLSAAAPITCRATPPPPARSTVGSSICGINCAACSGMGLRRGLLRAEGELFVLPLQSSRVDASGHSATETWFVYLRDRVCKWCTWSAIPYSTQCIGAPVRSGAGSGDRTGTGVCGDRCLVLIRVPTDVANNGTHPYCVQ